MQCHGRTSPSWPPSLTSHNVRHCLDQLLNLIAYVPALSAAFWTFAATFSTFLVKFFDILVWFLDILVHYLQLSRRSKPGSGMPGALLPTPPSWSSPVTPGYTSEFMVVFLYRILESDTSPDTGRNCLQVPHHLLHLPNKTIIGHFRAKREQLQSFDDFRIKAKARIWP